MSVSETERRVFGVRLESDKIPVIGAATFIGVSEAAAILRGASVRGFPISTEGSVVLYGPHHHITDPLILYWLVATKAGRSIRVAARRNLLKPEVKEKYQVLEWSGKKADPLDTAPNWQKVLRAKILKIGDPVEVDRLEYGEEFFNEVSGILNSGGGFGIFPQGTRRPRGVEDGFQRGISMIAAAHPDVPFQAVTIYNNEIKGLADLLKPIRILVGRPITYNDARNMVQGRLTWRKFTHVLENEVAMLTLDRYDAPTLYP